MGHGSMDARSEEAEPNGRATILLDENNYSAQELGSSTRRADMPLPRGSGYPVKRFFHSENQKVDADSLSAGSNNYGHFEWRTKSHVLKGKMLKTAVLGGFTLKGRTWFFSILISILVAFFFLSAMIQSSMNILFGRGDFLPGLVSFVERKPLADSLSFGDYVKFVPLKLEERFRSRTCLDEIRKEVRNPIRPPRLAFVSPHLRKDLASLFLVTIAKGLKELGYHIEVYTFHDGPSHSVWEDIGCSINVLDLDASGATAVDWSNFEGILLITPESKKVIRSLVQEPFSSIPLIWIIEDDSLANLLDMYETSERNHIVDDWYFAFQRADVVVFPDYALAMKYGRLDSGNFFVIPGSPYDAWIAERFSTSHRKGELRRNMQLKMDDFVILVIGSPFFYSAIWWEHTMVMHAVKPLTEKYFNGQRKRLRLIISGNNTTGEYNIALQAIASHLGLPEGSVQHCGCKNDLNKVLHVADLVVYGSMRDEQAFPPILIRAMSFGKLVIVPNLTAIENHIVNGTHALVFPAGNVEMMTNTISRVISNGRLSNLAQKIASSGKKHAKNMLASDSFLGYAALLEKILHFPSESMLPKPVSNIQLHTIRKWQWHHFMQHESSTTEHGVDHVSEGSEGITGESAAVLNIHDFWNTSIYSPYGIENGTGDLDETPREIDWSEQREMERLEEIERQEEQELEERTEPSRGSWDDIYRTARKAERIKFEMNERDEGELERTGQPLCIYEFYYGSGTWLFLHTGPLYRAISLYPQGRRSGADDVNAVDRLPLLNESYYNNVLCEFGGLLAIANKVDSVHKSPWIGFQSWRATGRKVSLSSEAERVLIERVQSGSDGDTIYFWARSDKDSAASIKGIKQEQVNDFWSYCDILNAGKCRVAFENAFRQIYDLPLNLSALPPMPYDGDSWSVLHSWVMPTSSFLEFVMFSRMFIDAVDAQHYEEHHNNGMCVLGTSKLEVKHCYCRLLELLVNVWSYHSARRMMYLDPRTGDLQEHHNLILRRGGMWVQYFNFTVLKSMDEDLAEGADDDSPNKRWLWPLTGEVHWQGIYEREREERYRQKMEKKRKAKEKLLERLRLGYKQKSLGKYMKPPSDPGTAKLESATDH